jgi:transcriptional regulator with XRE-family HTH domain
LKPDPTGTMLRLAQEVYAARTLRRMTIPQLADQIGISASALRRIENGKTKNAQGETLAAILVWAGRRGMKEFAGFTISPARPATQEAGHQ